MSGHSKWSTIKRQKGAADQKRGQMFTKLSLAITMAVREGGGIGDPNSNFRLRLAIDTARNANMPKENIERAIARASGKQVENVEEVVYEGFGPGGFSVIIEAITDNKQRTTPEVKSVFDKSGGSMGVPGAVSYQFQKSGNIVVSKQQSGKSFDDIFLLATDAGAEDIEESDEEVLIYTKPEALHAVSEALTAQQVPIVSAEIVRKPLTLAAITTEETARKALTFLERLENLDDIQKVYANYDMPDELLKIVAK